MRWSRLVALRQLSSRRIALNHEALFAAADKRQAATRRAIVRALDIAYRSVTNAEATAAWKQSPTALMRAIDWDAVAEAMGAQPGTYGVYKADTAATLFGQTYLSGARVAVDGMEQQLGQTISLNMTVQQSIDYGQQRAGALISGIQQTQLNAVRDTLALSLEQGVDVGSTGRILRGSVGLSPRQATALANYERGLTELYTTGRTSVTLRGLGRPLADARYSLDRLSEARIEEMVDRYRERLVNYRAEMIARTELARSANRGAYEEQMAQASDGLFGARSANRIWLTTPDDRLCEDCDAMDGQTISFLESFEYDSGADDEEPGAGEVTIMDVPPLHPNCRCTTILEITDESMIEAFGADSDVQDLVDLQGFEGDPFGEAAMSDEMTAEVMEIDSPQVAEAIGERLDSLRDDIMEEGGFTTPNLESGFRNTQAALNPAETQIDAINQYVAITEDGVVAGGSSVRSYVFEADEFDLDDDIAARIVENIGSTGIEPGVGRSLMEQMYQGALKDDVMLVGQPSREAVGFFERMGWRRDPLGIGDESMMGITPAEMRSVIAGTTETTSARAAAAEVLDELPTKVIEERLAVSTRSWGPEATQSIDDVLVHSARNAEHIVEHFEEGWRAIDFVHGLPDEAEAVQFESLKKAFPDLGRNTGGVFHHGGGNSWDRSLRFEGKTIQVVDGAKTGDKVSNFVHEFGHYLDNIGQRGRSYYVETQARIAIERGLSNDAALAFVEWVDGSEYMATRASTMSEGMAKYWTSPREAWARAYAQYIATEAREVAPGLYARLMKDTTVNRYGAVKQTVFPTDLFEAEIKPLVEAVLRQRGLIA